MAIVVPIISEWSPKGVDRAMADIKKAEGGWNKVGAGFQAAFAPAMLVMGGLTAGALALGKAAAEDAKGAALLANSLRKVAGASDETIASTEEWITAQGRALGVADDQLRPAMATLATATKDVGKAQELAGLAMDLSAAKGISLEAATNAIAKAYAGNTTALGKLVPGLDKAAVKSKDFGAISESLAGIVGGSAATAAGTAAGQMERFQLGISEAGESIGAALLPALDAVMPYLMDAAVWAQENSGVLLAMAAAVGVVAGAIIAVNVAMKAYVAIQAIVKAATVAWTVVQWLLNVALTMNPIGAVIMAIVAFIAIIVLLWNKCEWFRNGIKALWEALKAGAGAIKDGLGAVFSWLGDKIQWVMDKIQQLINAAKGILSKIPGLGGIIGGNSTMTLAAGPATRAAPSSSAPTVNVYGAVDPEGTARTIRNLLTGQDARQGRAYTAPRAVAW